MVVDLVFSQSPASQDLVFDASGAGGDVYNAVGKADISASTIGYARHGASGYSDNVTNISSYGKCQFDAVGATQLTYASNSSGAVGVVANANSYVSLAVQGDQRVIAIGNSQVTVETESIAIHGVSSTGFSYVLYPTTPYNDSIISTAINTVSYATVGSSGKINVELIVNSSATSKYGVTGDAKSDISIFADAVASQEFTIIDHRVDGIGDAQTNISIDISACVGVSGCGNAEVGVSVEDIQFKIIKFNEVGFPSIPEDNYNLYPEEHFIKSTYEAIEFSVDLQIISNLPIRSIVLMGDSSDLTSIILDNTTIRLVGNYLPKIDEINTYKIDNTSYITSRIMPDKYLALIKFYPEILNNYNNPIRFNVEYIDIRNNLKTSSIYLHQFVYWNINDSVDKFYKKLSYGKV